MTTRDRLEGLNHPDAGLIEEDLQMDEFSLTDLENLQDEALVTWRVVVDSPDPADIADAIAYREVYLHLGAAIAALKRTFARTN